MKKLLYFAGPLFNDAEKTFNDQLAMRLEELGYEVFLPQRDGVESSKPPYNTMNKDERRRVLFEMDRDKILACDVFLFVLDGRVPDEGACVELGIAYTDRLLNEKPRIIVGLQTDNRAAFLSSKLNPMLLMAIDFIAESRDQLEAYLASH
ncbi:MAG TPA: nucleoside 2-deoxyribosyltransferase [Ktedonobacterales bacterium]|jgi:nucleoside 2-deoxyribosyltransferase|nr:nucleoside 2-deoxyribosyltransferase [Ktedonobacterales bacterium]